VLPDVAAVKKTFDYLVPEHLEDRVRVGTQVRVVLHGRRVGAWVVEEDVVPNPAVTLRALESVRGWGPPPAVVALSDWAAWRWAGPASAFLKSGSPARVVSTLPRPTSPGASQRPASASSEEWASVLSGGAVVVRMAPASDPFSLVLSTADLLPASTGSEGPAGVLVLVPEHGDATRLAARISRSGRRVALMPGDWPAARAGGCVVVGTRAAAFAPLPRLAGALVLDAHEEAYYEQRAPTWCAWEVVAERANRDGAPCALVSPCPTLDLLHSRRLVKPSRPAEREGWPPIEIVDRREDDPRTGLFSERLVSLLRWAAAEPGRRVLCVLNRTGRVRLLACGSCREIARCETCSGALELIEEDGSQRLRCRRCGDERPVVCARCGGTRMRSLRVGVSRAREELEALAGVAVAEVWGPKDAGRASDVSEWGVDQEGAEGSSKRAGPVVVVGTEAVLHRAGPSDAIAFLDFDSELLAPRMRAAEEALALLARAARLVGGAGPYSGRAVYTSGGSPDPPMRSRGKVLVQTRMPNHEVLRAALLADPGRLAESEGSIRMSLGLPPFSAMALVSGASAAAYGEELRNAAPPEVEVTGPLDGKWSVRAPGHSQLCDLLASVRRSAGRLRVEVDPVRV